MQIYKTILLLADGETREVPKYSSFKLGKFEDIYFRRPERDNYPVFSSKASAIKAVKAGAMFALYPTPKKDLESYDTLEGKYNQVISYGCFGDCKGREPAITSEGLYYTFFESDLVSYSIYHSKDLKWLDKWLKMQFTKFIAECIRVDNALADAQAIIALQSMQFTLDDVYQTIRGGERYGFSVDYHGKRAWVTNDDYSEVANASKL